MAKKNRTSTCLDVACVIHSDKYDWTYVERLYNMVTRHISRPIRFHVYTEHDRPVPPHMIKHCLENWHGVSGPKKSWWYKLHLFNTQHHAGPLLYFDLDCVIVRSIDWVSDLVPDKLWCLRDFKYLQSPSINAVNSSVMWWDTRKFEHVWQEFHKQGIDQTVRRYHGDQDFIQVTVSHNDRRFFEDRLFQSYRWQVSQGGWDFRLRRPKIPRSPDQVSPECAVVVFHGNPKPHQITDSIITELWH